MPCFNGARHLPASTNSVLRQHCSDWELIIVDDGSTDDSWTAIRYLAARDCRIVALRQDNRGAAAARNAGLAAARGKWVAFLDCDDTWHPDFLGRMRAALDGVQDEALAYCGWQNIGGRYQSAAPFIPPDYEAPDKIELLLSNCRWPIHAALVSLSAVRMAGGFDPKFTSSEDYDLWLRLVCRMRLVRVPEVLAWYHFHGDTQLTSNVVRLERSHVRAQRKFVRTHPQEAAKLGAEKIRSLIEGEMHYRAFSHYWRDDLDIARPLFRSLMRRHYGSWRDWIHMTPALLPLPLHRFLLGRLRNKRIRAQR